MPPTLVPSVFTPGDPSTDFSQMIVDPAWSDALFVFNDNQGQFEAFMAGERTSACATGGGNAAIRPYQCKSPPRAAGIPTGPGFDALDAGSRKLIDEAVAHIAAVVKAQGYARVVYSASASDPGMIGTSIFHVGDDVRRYCVTALRRALGIDAAAAETSGLTPRPQPVEIQGQSLSLVAFYYPGHEAPWDRVYRAGFCGNFWQHPLILDIGGAKGRFHCAEAAFQATKWWTAPHIRHEFEGCRTGGEAFSLKKTLSDPDPGYAGLGRLGAMEAVLAAKFAAPTLRAGLLATGDAYLLEHNSTKGRDRFWSDDHDGTGHNHLGRLLMERRAELGGAGAPDGAWTVADFTAAVRTGD